MRLYHAVKETKQSQYVAAANKYPGGRDLSKIFQSTYIAFVENI